MGLPNFKKSSRVYLDYAASTPLRKEAFSAMLPFLKGGYGNPSSIHEEGVEAAAAVLKSKKTLASFLGAGPEEVVFTSGGTEANSLAILGTILPICLSGGLFNTHLITSSIEHSSVLEWFKLFERLGAQVSYLAPNGEGFLDPGELRWVLREETSLVSIMYANNEVGTVQPIEELGKVILSHRKNHSDSPIVFHTDASSAAAFLPISVLKNHADLLTLDAQKVYGPKGVGALFIRRGVRLQPLFPSGGSLRGGTPNVAGIVGFAKALELASLEREAETKRLLRLRNYFLEKILQNIKGVMVNGSLENRLPNNLNISIPGFDSTVLVAALDREGIAVSSRSACSLGPGGSHVVLAMGKDIKVASSTLRFTLGLYTTKKDLDRTVSALRQITGRRV